MAFSDSLNKFARGGLGQGLAAFAEGTTRGEIQSRQIGLDDKRKTAMARDALTAQTLLASGDIAGVNNLLQQRSQFIRQLGGDPSDTEELQQRLAAGDIAGVSKDLGIVVDGARSAGFLPKAEKEEAFTLSPGQVRFKDGEKVASVPLIAKETGRTEKDVQSQINTLRKDISASGKAFELVEAARNRIVKSGTKATAASDISLIFNFMKMNDPGSTVREGEFATAQNAAGVGGRIISMYNNMLEGTRLNPDQRADFISQSESLFEAQRQSFDSSIGRTLELADQDQIPRQRVLGAKRLEAFNTRTSERAATAKPQTGNIEFLGFE